MGPERVQFVQINSIARTCARISPIRLSSGQWRSCGSNTVWIGAHQSATLQSPVSNLNSSYVVFVCVHAELNSMRTDVVSQGALVAADRFGNFGAACAGYSDFSYSVVDSTTTGGEVRVYTVLAHA